MNSWGLYETGPWACPDHDNIVAHMLTPEEISEDITMRRLLDKLSTAIELAIAAGSDITAITKDLGNSIMTIEVEDLPEQRRP
jgi:hypothetical protein